jgi:gluconokinase
LRALTVKPPELLARRLGFEFHEGDDFHTESSVRKMSAGIALTDEDRAPWLAAIRALIEPSRAFKVDAVCTPEEIVDRIVSQVRGLARTRGKA